MKGNGQGWTGESRRHGLARMGYKTVLPDGRRLHMGNFVAGGHNPRIPEIVFEDAFKKGNIIVWDNGGETADRYTVLLEGRYVFGMNSNPFHPTYGFSQYSGDLEHWSKGNTTPFNSPEEWIEMWDKGKEKRLNVDEIPPDTKKAILQRMEDD